MSKPVSKTMILFAIAFSFALISVNCGGSKSSSLRIGTFDSRAVALAYYGSEEGTMQLEKEGGPGLEMRSHQQTFSTGPVTDIIEKKSSALSSLAKEADVSIIVSKWQIVHKDPSAEYVDVTSALVKLFSPSDEMRKTIEDWRKTEPLPIKEMWTIP